MSRILKALATIESKGATLSMPAARPELSRQPRRRSGTQAAELSLAALEAYLQAALSAEQKLWRELDADEALAFFCTPGDAGPSLGAPDLAAAAVETADAVTEWGVRDSGPGARFSIVDRETFAPPADDIDVASALSPDDTLSAIDFAAVPSDEVFAVAELESVPWDDSLYELATNPVEEPAAPETKSGDSVQTFALAPVDPFDSLVLAACGDGTIEACGFIAVPAAEAQSREVVAPDSLAGWPEAIPLEAEAEEPPDALVDVNAATWLVTASEFGWVDEYLLTSAEADEQYWLAPPDWVEVEAAVEALPLTATGPSASISAPVQAQSTVARQRLTSRDLLPDEHAWTECRAIADAIRGARAGGKPSNYLLVELSPATRSAPLVAPLAAMLAELSRSRVLLIDTDRGPGDAIERLHGAPLPGFADVAGNPEAWPSLVMNSAVPRLDLLPAGGVTPRGEQAMEEFSLPAWLATLARAYEVVLLHALWRDGKELQRLASAADATLLVAALGEVDEDAAAAAVERLRAWGARVEGCIAVEGE